MILLIKYSILGIVQGLTEFLPVSSSGHLVVLQHFFGFEEPPIFYDILLHLATGIAVVYFVRKEIWAILKNMFHFKSPYFKLLILLIVASVPTAIIGILFEKNIEMLFSSVSLVAIALIVNGIVLFLASRITLCKIPKSITGIKIVDAMIIGVSQGLAIIPGFSRSGFTITAGLFCKIDREVAARFSFILAIPAILGALVFKLKEGMAEIQSDILYMIPGFILAVLVGFWSLGLLLRLIKSFKLQYFSYYCWFIGIVVLIFQFFN